MEEKLLKMERAMSKIQGYDGWMIGKCRVSLHVPAGQESAHPSCGGRCSAEIIKRGSASIVIRVEEERDDRPFPGEPESEKDFLQVLLVNPNVEYGKNAAGNARRSDQKVRGEEERAAGCIVGTICFSSGCIETFLEAAADQNPIHQGPEAIVPGLLMMNRIAAYTLKAAGGKPEGDSRRIAMEAKFLFPLRVGEEAVLESVFEAEGNKTYLLATPARGLAMKMTVTMR